MKKGFLILLLSISSFLFAEGYRGTRWYSSIQEVEQAKTFLVSDFAYGDIGTLNEKIIILGEETRIFYGFFFNKLNNIFYITDLSSKDLLINKLDNSKDYKKVASRKVNHEEHFNLEALSEFRCDYWETSLYITLLRASEDYFTGDNPIDVDEVGDGPANTEIFIYDYNDDTRIVIYSNTIKDKIIVSYFPKQQDF